MRRIDTLLMQNADLSALSSQARSLAAMQNLWQDIAPEPLKTFSRAGALTHKRLTVYADNGAVATKIKLLLPSLLTKLQKQGLEVTSIRVEVQVQSGSRRVTKQVRHLSPQASSSLHQLADTLADSPLGQALARLASRT